MAILLTLLPSLGTIGLLLLRIDLQWRTDSGSRRAAARLSKVRRRQANGEVLVGGYPCRHAPVGRQVPKARPASGHAGPRACPRLLHPGDDRAIARGHWRTPV